MEATTITGAVNVNDAAAKQIEKIIRRFKETRAAVTRKRKLRPSEKAMWLSEIDADITALDVAISALRGTPLQS